MSATGIYGLSGSGIDVDSMVRVGMMTKQSEYDRMYKKEVRQEWLKEKYADTYSDISKFANTTMSNYKMSSTLNPHTVSSSKDDVATAVANADAAQMTHSVNVTKMASNAYLLTKDEITRTGASQSIYLADIFDTTNTSNWSSGDSLSIEVSDGNKTETLKITYGEVMDNRQTLNDLASKFNGLGLNIKASYDSANDAFSLYNAAGGSTNGIIMTAKDDNAAALLTHLGLGEVTVDSSSGASNLGNPITFTKDNKSETMGGSAELTIDGKAYTSDTNKVSAANVTYTIKSVGSTTMTVSQDTDKLVENVKKFVDDYNEMLDKLNTMYNEQKYSDYDVLTESQKKGMTEEQIQKWEEKAKSGLFYHNQEIGKLISDLREAIYTPVDSVDSKYKTMMSIGIESKTDRGQLKIDEDKLRSAIAADPDVVYQLLGASGEKTRTLQNGTTETYTDFNSEGVANRIYDKALNAMSSIKSYAGTSSEVSDGSSLGDLIRNMQQKMSDFKTMMNAFESKLYKKYDAMEIAIQRLGVSLGYIIGDQWQ